MDAITENWLLRINNLKINNNIVIFFRKTILGSLKISKKIKNNHQGDLVKKSWYIPGYAKSGSIIRIKWPTKL